MNMRWGYQVEVRGRDAQLAVSTRHLFRVYRSVFDIKPKTRNLKPKPCVPKTETNRLTVIRRQWRRGCCGPFAPVKC